MAVKQGTVQRVCCWVGCFVWSTGCIPWGQSTPQDWYKRTPDSEISHLFIQNTECFRTILALLSPRLTCHQKKKKKLHISEVKLQKELVFKMHTWIISIMRWHLCPASVFLTHRHYQHLRITDINGKDGTTANHPTVIPSNKEQFFV